MPTCSSIRNQTTKDRHNFVFYTEIATSTRIKQDHTRIIFDIVSCHFSQFIFQFGIFLSLLIRCKICIRFNFFDSGITFLNNLRNRSKNCFTKRRSNGCSNFQTKERIVVNKISICSSGKFIFHDIVTQFIDKRTEVLFSKRSIDKSSDRIYFSFNTHFIEDNSASCSLHQFFIHILFWL